MRDVTTTVHLVMPENCNGYEKPRLFGGQIMEWIDIIGAVAARRYAKSNVTTVCVDNLTFVKPAFLNDTIVQKAYVTWTGKTSMEVRVDSYVETYDEEQQLINTAYLVFVALDENGTPTPVPKYEPETYEEREEWYEADARHELRKQRK